MGDRTGLTKLDRTNGFDDGRDYMRVKKSKLAQQNDEIREALRSRNSSMRTEIFKGVSINVNGRTQPTADELKRLILLNGGEYHPYYRYQTTKFMIATNLSVARMKQLRPDDRIVKPEWITESIQAKCLLPYEDYQLFVGEPRGKNGGSVLAIDQSSSSSTSFQDHKQQQQQQPQLESNVSSYSRNYRGKNRGKPDPSAETRSRDIREMFTKSVRSIHDTSQCKPKQSSSNGVSTMMSIKAAKQPSTLPDLINRGPRKHKFHQPKNPEQRYQASISGYTNLDDIVRVLNEWIGCPEGITEEDIACVTKYFFDLMSERDYHNKFYELIDSLQQRVIQHHEVCWISVYNNLVRALKDDLKQAIEASQNLYQLIGTISEDQVKQDLEVEIIDEVPSPDFNEPPNVGDNYEDDHDDDDLNNNNDFEEKEIVAPQIEWFEEDVEEDDAVTEGKSND